MKKEKWAKSSVAAISALIIILLLIAFVIWRFFVFFAPKDSEQPNLSPDDLTVETEDYYCIQDVTESEEDGVTTILVLGDDSFSYERGSEGLAALVAGKTNATIYNCTFEGTSICGDSIGFDLDNPIESFSLYWLMIAIRDNQFGNQEVSLTRMENKPSYFNETFELLRTIDYDTLDMIILSYGINDYLKGHITTDVNNETNPSSVYGGLISSINIIQKMYPHIKIIVNSPTYAYYTEEDGTLSGGDYRMTGTQTNENLGGYMINMKNAAVNSCATGVTFIDNYFGVNIKYENAEDYLTDSPIVPNTAGRKLLAEHIANVINNYMY